MGAFSNVSVCVFVCVPCVVELSWVSYASIFNYVLCYNVKLLYLSVVAHVTRLICVTLFPILFVCYIMCNSFSLYLCVALVPITITSNQQTERFHNVCMAWPRSIRRTELIIRFGQFSVYNVVYRCDCCRFFFTLCGKCANLE